MDGPCPLSDFSEDEKADSGSIRSVETIETGGKGSRNGDVMSGRESLPRSAGSQQA